MSIVRPNAESLGILLVDVQPRFLDVMQGDQQSLLDRLAQLLIFSEWLQLPVMATLESPVEEKGRLPKKLKKVFPEGGRVFEKATYDLCRQQEIVTAVERLGKRQWAVAGAEIDVCVLQSVLGLRARGDDVFVLEDCCFSSTKRTQAAFRRMQQAGAVCSTYKSLYYELLETEDSAQWPPGYPQAVKCGLLPPEDVTD